ncbi:MAG: sulfatase-like hydrolase/transferase, partial [Planctomycetota bacterium]
PESVKSGIALGAFGRTDQEFHQLETDPAGFPSRNWLPLEQKTYAEALATLGYISHFIGKWHLGHDPYHPVHQGFDSQFGTTNFGHPKSYLAPFFANSDVLDHITEGHLTDTLTDEAVRLIRDSGHSQPFMLSLWYYGVHRPPVGRADLVEHFRRKGYEKTEAVYAAQVKALDESVGRIREALMRREIANDTVLIFLSDQGSLYSNSPLRGTKRSDTLCEGGARVPFLIHYPGVTRSGALCRIPVSSTDLFPTLVEVAGGDAAAYSQLDGQSLMSIIHGNDPPNRGVPLIGYRAYQDLYASVRQGDWNMLVYRSGKTELYDVAQDVGEERDIALKHPKTVDRLTERLVSWEKETGVYRFSGTRPEFRHLFGAKLLLDKIQRLAPTPLQLDEFDRLSRHYKAEVLALRESAGIVKDTIKRRDVAFKSLKNSGLTGDEFWLELQKRAGISETQRDAFRKTKGCSNRFKSEIRRLLTDEQRRQLSTKP